MNEYMQKKIMVESRHQFIYGYDSKERTEFLKSLEDKYPIKTNIISPMAIYMEDYALPQIDNIPKTIDNYMLMKIFSEYFNISMIKRIIYKIINQKNLNIMDEYIDTFLKGISMMTSDTSKLISLENFLNELNNSTEFYLEYYKKIINGEQELPNINEIKMPFIMPDLIIPRIKRMLKNSSYFGIIIDKQDNIALNTIKIINNYITRRINSDLSIKIACEPDQWPTYYNEVGILAEATHDYGKIEFDNSYQEYTKKLINKHKF